MAVTRRDKLEHKPEFKNRHTFCWTWSIDIMCFFLCVNANRALVDEKTPQGLLNLERKWWRLLLEVKPVWFGRHQFQQEAHKWEREGRGWKAWIWMRLWLEDLLLLHEMWSLSYQTKVKELRFRVAIKSCWTFLDDLTGKNAKIDDLFFTRLSTSFSLKISEGALENLLCVSMCLHVYCRDEHNANASVPVSLRICCVHSPSKHLKRAIADSLPPSLSFCPLSSLCRTSFYICFTSKKNMLFLFGYKEIKVAWLVFLEWIWKSVLCTRFSNPADHLQMNVIQPRISVISFICSTCFCSRWKETKHKEKRVDRRD